MDARVIGIHIREYRKSKHMSQREFAELLYVSDKTVSRWELGKGLPDIAELPRIAQMLGITIDELVGEKVTSDNAAIVAAKMEKYGFKLRTVYALILLTVMLMSIVILMLTTGMLDTYESTYIFEAEDALFTDSFKVEDVEHASGGKVAAWMHTSGEILTIKVMSNRVAKVRMDMVVNRARAFNFEDKMTLAVNGYPMNVGVVYGVGWDGSAEEFFYKFGEPITVDATFRKGENIITVTIIDGYNLNIDCFMLTTTAKLTLMLEHFSFEAEDAKISGLYSLISSGHASGGKYLGGLTTAGDTLSYKITSDYDAFVMLEIYINRPDKTVFENKFTLTVNGKLITVGEKEGIGVTVPEDREYSFSDPFTVGVSLKTGENNIIFTVVSGANFDRIAINTSLKLAAIK